MHRILRWVSAICGMVLVVPAVAEAPARAVVGYDKYVSGVEARLAGQHRSDLGFVAGVGLDAGVSARVRRGELVVERLTPDGGGTLQGAVVHHWRGTAFVPGATAAEVERLMRGFDAYSRVFAPQVVSARVVSGAGDRVQVSMRVRQQHVITVVMDTNYDVTFARLDARDGYSLSRSTRVQEVGGDDHGFLWRQSTYWNWAERDGGVYVQMESVSLTRAVPRGLGWAVGPFVESVPKESVEFTLHAVSAALQAKGGGR
jgi:hypothetical protein